MNNGTLSGQKGALIIDLQLQQASGPTAAARPWSDSKPIENPAARSSKPLRRMDDERTEAAEAGLLAFFLVFRESQSRDISVHYYFSLLNTFTARGCS
ncbi:hypothetical protein [Methyloterricola oryzae]|uniref:hypothetical protein n=1 Tax=Methyloterricola oryzae TaxID=1495050 RepID=UPI001300EC60|nr:hypothetical protein [Methyloterricola oryzae]